MELGPYKHQRNRQIGNKYPRAPQPGIQPNRKPPVQGWGKTTLSYYQEVFVEFLRRRG